MPPVFRNHSCKFEETNILLETTVIDLHYFMLSPIIFPVNTLYFGKPAFSIFDIQLRVLNIVFDLHNVL